jgi:parvulin-like peptidyl-prolyl isomerase
MKALFILGWLIGSISISTSAQIVATVGGSKISLEDFRKKLEDVRKQSVNPPTPEQFLEDLVRFEIGVQEAKKIGLENDEMVRERYKQLLYNSLLEKEIGTKLVDVKITENEMKESYKKTPELRLAHILIDVKDGASAAERELAKKRAVEILEDVKKSKRPFEELVKLYSDDLPTKESGGDIGFQSKMTLTPIIYDAAVGLKVGEVKGLIETKFGFHIVKLLERRTYDLADKHQLRAVLLDGKRAKIFDDYFIRAKKTYKVEINKDALKTVAN